jgi:hypothetical protein
MRVFLGSRGVIDHQHGIVAAETSLTGRFRPRTAMKCAIGLIRQAQAIRYQLNALAIVKTDQP